MHNQDLKHNQDKMTSQGAQMFTPYRDGSINSVCHFSVFASSHSSQQNTEKVKKTALANKCGALTAVHVHVVETRKKKKEKKIHIISFSVGNNGFYIPAWWTTMSACQG